MRSFAFWAVVAIVVSMNKDYIVTKPQDFGEVIDDILAWHKDSAQPTLVIALKGDLGAGKTTFTQTLGKHLGVEEAITSPTFTIMKQYELSDDRFDSLVHIDAYRIESEDETKPLRLEEIFIQPSTVVCVEWPEQIPSIVPDTAVLVSLNIIENETRNVTIQFPSEK